jgi:hypothetical protein
MVMSDLMAALRRSGLDVTEAQVRWAIKTKRVPVPKRDGALRFKFGQQNLHSLIRFFQRPAAERRKNSRSRSDYDSEPHRRGTGSDEDF